MGTIDNDYKLIPMSEITDEAREIAVRWGDNMKIDFITEKHKLASDIMNYARRYHEQEMKKNSCRTEYNKRKGESAFAMSNALGFKEPADGQMDLHVMGYSHCMNFSDVENVCQWLFERKYDIIKPKK